MMPKVLYTTTATATGGRSGHTQSADGVVSADLAVPESMGGASRPGRTTPEDLFACGYAACFGSACEVAARSILHLVAKSIEIECTVGIGTLPAGGYGLVIDLVARIQGLEPAQADAIVRKADEICPYSNAIRNNVPVTVKAVVI